VNLSVTHYSGDRMGGAARAALRIHAALRQQSAIDSNMIVVERPNDDSSISALDTGLLGQLRGIFKSTVESIPWRLATPRDNMPRSAGWASRLMAKEINSHHSDIAHLHWINGAFLSVEEIGKITKPLVWTLHDMWPFCGAEHLAPDTPEARWRNGYQPTPDLPDFDIDRWVWKRKSSSWLKPINLVTPSRWLADCVRQSTLMQRFPVSIIPNPLNTDIYKPMNKYHARELLNLPINQKLVLFGAIKGTMLNYKGWDLLMPALEVIYDNFPNADAVIFGQSQPNDPPAIRTRVHWMGHLHDDFTLAALYSAADVLIVPSRQESFGQTGSEAQACGCPVVAFNSTGLRDVVDHGVTGYLVKPFDAYELALAALNVINNSDISLAFSLEARKRAINLWSYSVVSEKYNDLYSQIIA